RCFSVMRMARRLSGNCSTPRIFVSLCDSEGAGRTKNFGVIPCSSCNWSRPGCVSVPLCCPSYNCADHGARKHDLEIIPVLHRRDAISQKQPDRQPEEQPANDGI